MQAEAILQRPQHPDMVDTQGTSPLMEAYLVAEWVSNYKYYGRLYEGNNCVHFTLLGDSIIHYRTESVHFAVLVKSVTKKRPLWAATWKF